MRFARFLLAALLVVAPPASVHSQAPVGPFICGQTGFNGNVGVATKSFRCSFRPMIRGAGTLTLNATATVTSSSPGFTSLAALDAVPGADDTFFRTSGLMVRLAGRTYFYRITAAASAVSVTVDDGGAAPAQSGTTTNWSYWNTTCYRSADNVGVVAAVNDFADDRIWDSPMGARASISGNGTSQSVLAFNYLLAAGVGPAVAIGFRPAGSGLPPTFSATNTFLNTTADSFSLANISLSTFVPPEWPEELPFQIQASVQSTAAANYPVVCMMAWH